MEIEGDGTLDVFVIVLLVTYVVLIAAHLLSIWLCARRAPFRSQRLVAAPPVTLVRPICGLDDVERITLASTFSLRANDLEIIFCAEDPADPAVAFVEGLIAQHPQANARVLIGSELRSPNPKLNNIVKGWRAATREWVLITDSNLLLPPDYLDRIFERADADTGLVSAPPIGSHPGSFWAEVECAFLNTFQARWQYAADVVDYGFAQGKTMLWRKADLEPEGGIRALARELAEDAAATKLVRSWGKHVRLADPCFEQPLGIRSARQVVSRQSRWAQLRRGAFPSHYSAEVLLGALPPLVVLGLVVSWLDMDFLPLALAHLAVWYGAEAVLARTMGWRWTLATLPASIVRDALLPAIWLRGWQRTRYVWRGNVIDTRNPVGEEDAAAPAPALAVAAEDVRKS